MSPVQVVPAAAGPFADMGQAMRRLERIHGCDMRNWIYQDAARNDVAVIFQWEKDTGPVRRTIRHCPGGGWAIGSMLRPWLLYALPEVLESPDRRVYVTGNEDAADHALWYGLLATTSAQGCAGVGKTDWGPLT